MAFLFAMDTIKKSIRASKAHVSPFPNPFLIRAAALPLHTKPAPLQASFHPLYPTFKHPDNVLSTMRHSTPAKPMSKRSEHPISHHSLAFPMSLPEKIGARPVPKTMGVENSIKKPLVAAAHSSALEKTLEIFG
jgi:hypothetical protein